MYVFTKDSDVKDDFSQRAAHLAQSFSDKRLEDARVFVRKTGSFGRLVLSCENANCFDIAVRVTNVTVRIKQAGDLAQPLDFEHDSVSKPRKIVIPLDGDVFGCKAMNTPCLEGRAVEDKYVKMVVQVSFVVGENEDAEGTKAIPIYFKIHSGCLQERLVLRWKHLKEKVPQVFRAATQATENATRGRIWSPATRGMTGTGRRPAGGNP